MEMNVDPDVVQARFLANTKRQKNGCLKWKISLANGYGRFGVNKKRILAHRFAYMWFVGSIPDGSVINHKCRNKSCVEPSHLEAISPSTNTRFHYNGY